jgi:hypothetical protein
MNENFGHYIKPHRWKNRNGKLTHTQIKKVIRAEIIKKATKRIGLPRGLSQRKFANNLDVKIEVANKLKQEDIKIPVDFNYSFKEFKVYYNIAMMKKINSAPKTFYNKLERKIGRNDLKLNMDWTSFIHSNYIKSKIIAKVGSDDIQTIIKVIESKDLANFKKMIYLPKIVKKIEEEYEYKKDDFLDGHKAAAKGDEAIKLLYIPPFALSVSILALLLNIVTVVGMTLNYFRVPNIAVNISKIVLLAFIIFLPFTAKDNGLDNKLIEKLSSPNLQNYLDFLNWLSYYERINYSLH